MAFLFTPAAERALASAAQWTGCADADDLHVPEVLLGLLAEPECRAALLMELAGVSTEAILDRFSSLAPLNTPHETRAQRFSAELSHCFQLAEARLLEYPRPLYLATEHLLLGIAAADNEVSRWLAERGLKADQLEQEVHRFAGHRPGPLEVDFPLEIPWSEDTLANVSPPEATDSSAEYNLASSQTPIAHASSVPSPETISRPMEIDTFHGLGTLRVIDAAANRAGEGLRVVEDFARFVLDDRHLTELLKAIRHELTAALAIYAPQDRHAARETRQDVGATIALPAEQARTDTLHVVQANFKRVEQALRSLEEFSKAVAPTTAAAIEQLRYRVYTLERSLDITQDSLQRLAGVRLYVLIDACRTADDLRHLVEALVQAKVGAIQLREKQLQDRDLLDRARVVRRLTAGTDTLFIMNDRPDLAVLSGADGVHVGQEELSVKDARRVLGVAGLIGVSTHSLEQARGAVLDGANYIGVGPTFPSATKQFASFPGIDLLRAVQREIRLPAFAIGGITAETLPQVLATGFGRVAVSSAVTTAQDPGVAARQLLSALDQAAGS